MKELLQSFFKTTEERIRNPFIGAFMTSWFLFNWKPILFLFLSSKTIESKITYVEANFSNIWFIFFLPLISAFFYVLILPYLNLLFEELVKYSLLKRNNLHINKQKQNIENQKQLAIEEIKLEEAKTEFRERKTHNQLVEDLQKKNKEYEEVIENERSKSLTTIEDLKNEITKRDEMTSTEFRNFERRNSETRAETIELTERIYERDKQIQELTLLLNSTRLKNEESEKTLKNEKLKSSIMIEDLRKQMFKQEEVRIHDSKNYEVKNNELNSKLKTLNEEISYKQKLIEELTLMIDDDRIKNNLSQSSLLFENGLELIERYEGNEVFYFDKQKTHLYSVNEISELMDKYKYKRTVLK